MVEASDAIEGVDDAFPLNPAQLGMLFHSLAEPGTGVYVGILDATLPDNLDEIAFRQAWDIVVACHDALRSIIVWEGVDEPLQVVRSAVEIKWEILDDPLPVEDGKLSRSFVETFRKEGVDLSREPAMRFALGNLSTGDRSFIWACHHALIDDWSQAMVLDEVQQVYRSLVDGNEPEAASGPAIGAFADWLAARDVDADEAFWREEFAGSPQPARLQLPGPSAHRQDTEIRGQLDQRLDRETSDRLRQAANNSRVTLAALATGVWSVVLHRLTDSDDIAFGLAATLRPPEIEGIDRAVGNFVTTLPVRSRINDHRSLRDLVQSNHGFIQDARPRSGIALTRVQELAGLSNRTPLIGSILSIKQDALSVLKSGEDPLFCDPFIQFKSNFPLAIVVMPGDEIALRVIYDPRRFDVSAARIVLDCFAAALTAAPQGLDSPPARLSLMTNDQAARAMAGLVGSPLPDHDDVLKQVRMAAARDPSRIAIQSSMDKVTYGDLILAVDAIATRLSKLGIARGDRVGLYLDRSADVPVAMLGCLAAGAAYVPFDAAFPDKRLDRMIAASKLSAMMTTEEHRSRLSGHTRQTLTLADLAAPLDGPPQIAQPEPDDIAYVMFTSGSTGTPKGVMISHANLAASNAARLAWYGAGPERYLLLSSHAFDSSVAGIYWTLSTGGTLFVPSADQTRDLPTLASMFWDWRITHTLCLPSLYQLLLETTPDALRALETVIVAGEATPQELASAHHNSGLSARLVNEYGPTEATVWCAVADLSDWQQGGDVPIGGPIPGATLQVRDRHGNLVPPGLPGELIVGGAGVATGYLENETETDTRFFTAEDGERFYRTGDMVRQSADGTLTYLGRADGQVKIRGYRVELAEIEKVLAGRPDVREAAVAVFGEGPDAWLAGFVVAREGKNLGPDDLARTCEAALPRYMTPARFVLIDQMPRTPNGKIDRKALPRPERAIPAQEITKPTTQTESALAEVWRTALWLDREVGINEDFHDLGGHSLVAIRLLNEIQETFSIKLPASSLGQITTVAEQAKAIETARRKGAGVARPPMAARTPDVLAGLTDEEEAQLHLMVSTWRAPAARDGFKIRVANETGSLPPLFFCFLNEYSFNQLAEALGPDQPVYAIRGPNGVIAIAGEEHGDASMRRTALSYLPEVLELAGDRPIMLGGYCQGASVALDLGALLTAVQRPVSTVISVEYAPPLQYPGHVDLIFTADGLANPYLQFEKPEMVWARRYGSHSFELVPGEYLNVFHPQYLVDLSASIRRRLAEARIRALPTLTLAARAVTWGEAPKTARFRPGDTRAVEINLCNAGNARWPETRASGLRLKAEWQDENSDPVPGFHSYADLAEPVEEGAWTALSLPLTAPGQPGRYKVEVDLIEEGVAAFSKMGNPKLIVPITVDAAASAPVASIETEEIGTADPLHDLASALSIATEKAAARGAGPGSGGIDHHLVASLRNLGLLHLRAGRLGEAARSLQSALDLNPEDGKSLLALARVRLSQKRFLAAQRLIWRAGATDSETATEAKALQAVHLSPRSIVRFVRKRFRGAKVTGLESKKH